MTDGCWVQFWDDKDCQGATLRFDTEHGPLYVDHLDDYTQSDGDKEGNEPDSLETGSRSWLVVYKDNNYGGRSAMFGPNSKIDDLGASQYDMGGNISSFKLYDYRPSWFVDSATWNPTAIETDNAVVNAQSVNNFFRTFVAAGVNLIPEMGGALGELVSGLWPNVSNRDQVWACSLVTIWDLRASRIRSRASPQPSTVNALSAGHLSLEAASAFEGSPQAAMDDVEFGIVTSLGTWRQDAAAV